MYGVHLVHDAPAHRSQAVAGTVCRRKGGLGGTWHTESDGRNVRWLAHWAGDDCRFDLRATGDVKFNSDFTDIASVANGGTFELTDVQGNTTRRLTMRPDGSGRLVRSYSVNGRDQAWDDQGQRWLAEVLVELDRMSGVGIDYRYGSLFAHGGARAVIDEAEKMTGDYPRGMYLRRLVDSATLTDGEYQRVVGAASRDMSSDYERSRVLQTVLAKSPSSREVARSAARAAGTFSSDYERSRVLLAAIDSKALEGDDVISVIETVARSSSDYEKARVLLAVAARWTLTADSRKAYLRAADTIRSDYENRRVLSALVKQEAR